MVGRGWLHRQRDQKACQLMGAPLIPLTDLGSAKYLGFAGGLYPNGKNSPPSAYEQAGIALAATVQALDTAGEPSTSGKIVMLCIGMSNASSEFSQFIRLADAAGRTNPG